MKSVPRKKIIFVIVEGPSDETALSAILDQIYDRNAVVIYMSRRCDITTEKGTTPSNIVIYNLNETRTSDLQGIIQRNLQKKKNLNKLCGCKEIWSVPYRVFYMSCNLDHVLYNKLNSTDTEKENDSFAFAKKIQNRHPRISLIRF